MVYSIDVVESLGEAAGCGVACSKFDSDIQHCATEDDRITGHTLGRCRGIRRLSYTPLYSQIIYKTNLTLPPRLLEKVIDIEVSSSTPSPTIDPSVHTILIGHSMGGIVAADTLLAITSDLTIPSRPSSSSQTLSNPNPNPGPAINSLMFPYISGVLAFDTPYLGISPGVVAHGAEDHYNTASSAITQLSGLTGAIWGGSKAASEVDKDGKVKKEPVAALPAPSSSTDAPAPAWQKWGKLAALAGAGAAVAGGAAAAYMKREQITAGWSWVGSHLEFVGCLMKGEELRKRVSGLVTLNKELGVGWANLYTRLGKRALSKSDGVTIVGSVVGNQRTFCNLPGGRDKSTGGREYWSEAINDAAGDETGAHMSKFLSSYPSYVRFPLAEMAVLTNTQACSFPKTTQVTTPFLKTPRNSLSTGRRMNGTSPAQEMRICLGLSTRSYRTGGRLRFDGVWIMVCGYLPTGHINCNA